MPAEVSFESFKEELVRLVEKFQKGLAEFKGPTYDERALRSDFLDRLWLALGWDLQNRANLPQSLREVEQETRVEVAGRKKRADYTFRTDGIDRFVCEAKKPREELTPKYAYQAQRYAFNLKVLLALLTDFEGFHLYVVGGKPDREAPFEAYYRWHFSEYLKHADEIWDLFARENVAAGSQDKFIAGLPKKPIKGKPRQGWLIPRERQRTVDTEFLAYVEEQRGILARDLVRQNKKYQWDDATLNEAVQRILDRILFIRICEDRDIDTGRALDRLVEDWRRISTARPPLYPRLVAHFQSLDKPFNGALFRQGHLSEQVRLSDEFLADFITDLSSEDSPYLFSTLPVEILGSVYERFIGKAVHVTKAGKVGVEPKPEVRKAGGIYYTPRYIVDYIVEHTVGKLLEGKSPKELSKLRILDPACGSGSFLIRGFERICEHYLKWYHENPNGQPEENCYRDAEGNLRLTTHLKRQVLLDNVFGVDLDPQAVEVTMLSLYLKILEGETRSTLGRQQRLFPKESFLPDLKNNIRLGNSLIENDYFDLFSDGDERARIKPFDWKVEFRDIMGAGGFDAVIGNPPYVRPHRVPVPIKKYLWRNYSSYARKSDILNCFLERGVSLLRDGGYLGMITSDTWRILDSSKNLRDAMLRTCAVINLRLLPVGVFERVSVKPVVIVLRKQSDSRRFESQVLVTDEQGGSYLVPQQRWLNNKGYVFDTVQPKGAQLKHKIETDKVTFGEIVTVDFGLKTGNDRRFLRNRKKSRWDKPLVASAGVGRYYLDWHGRYVWYRPDLMKTEKATARPGEPERFEREKLIVSRMAHGLVGTLDKRHYYIKDALLAAKPRGSYDLRFLLGLINSKLLNYWYLSTFTSVDTHRNELMQVPIPKIDPANSTGKKLHDKITTLANRMLELVQKLRRAKSDAERQTLENAIRATDRAIDELVYDLYGLTDAERRLVEEAVGD